MTYACTFDTTKPFKTKRNFRAQSRHCRYIQWPSAVLHQYLNPHAFHYLVFFSNAEVNTAGVFGLSGCGGAGFGGGKLDLMEQEVI